MLGAFVQANYPRLRLFCNSMAIMQGTAVYIAAKPVRQGLTEVGRCM